MNKTERNNKIIEEYLQGVSTIKLGEKYNLTHSGINYILKKNNITRRSNKINSRKYSLNENYFEIIDTEEKAYWLGFIYADGYISVSNEYKKFGISLKESDKTHLEKFKNSINSTYPIKIYEPSGENYSTKPYCRILMSSDKIVEDLIKLGVVEHKSSILKFPTKEQVPEHLIHHFIRGYFDGDGCVTSYMNEGYERYKTSFIGTYDFLNKINEIINNKYGIKIPKLFKRKEYQEVYSLEYSSCKRSKILYEYMYKDATIYLDRKYEKFSRLMKK